MSTVSNVYAVTRREFLTRAMSRTFVVSTALLVVGVVAIALAPVIIRYVDRTDAQRVAVWTGARDLGVDPVSTISVLLNAPIDGRYPAGGRGTRFRRSRRSRISPLPGPP